MNKYEKLIEYIINDETEKARSLFHTIVVEKSRDIYESLVDEEDRVGGNKVNDLVDEVTVDEEGMRESEEEEEFGADDAELDDSEFDYDQDGAEDEHEEDHEGLENRVIDLEAAFDDLQAEFDSLMADEENEPEHAGMFSDEDDDAQSSEEDDQYSFDNDDQEMDEHMVREYVEKVGEPYKGELDKTEGRFVGKGGSTTINKRSPEASPNRMGGESLKFGQPGNRDPDGTAVNKGEANAYKKGEGKLKGAGSYENVPGAKAGQAFNKKATQYEKNRGAEGQTTSGKLAVNTKSEIGGKVR